MEQILSQEEIDALLKGLSTGEVEAEEKNTDNILGVSSYDLTNQDRIIRGRMPTLDTIDEKFGRMFRLSLSSVLGKMLDISVLSTESKKFSDFLKTVPAPSSINIFRMEPLMGFALFVLEVPLVYYLVDSFFGGGGKFNTRHVKTEGRDFTAIEQLIIKKVSNLAFEEMEKAWKPVYKIKIEYVRSEINPEFVAIVAPYEAVVVINFHVETDNYAGNMILCFPYSLLEPIRGKLNAGFQSDRLEIDTKWIARLQNRLRNCDVVLTAELGQAEITVQDLVNLKVGDTIQLSRDVDEDLIMKVEDVSKFQGEVGRLKGNIAFKVKSWITFND